MRRTSVLLGFLVSACGTTIDAPPPPETEFPLSIDHPEARLPDELLDVPEERVAMVDGDQPPVDPARASRSVRYFPDTRQQLMTDDSSQVAPEVAGDQLLPGERGMEIERPALDIAAKRSPVIFGSDGRVSVGSTLEWPARAIVKIYTTWPNGARGGCSGTLIGRKSVITAGHCVYNPDKGGWAASTQIIPALDGSYMPFGSAWQVYFDSVTGWTEDQNNDYDYSMITLDRNLGDATGWFGLASLSDSTLDGIGSAIAGYPGDLAGGVGQYVAYGPIEDFDSTMLYYDIDTMPGDSGASVHGSGAYRDYVYGVHGGDGIFWFEHYNRAARINSTRFYKILDWINNRAGLPTTGGDFSYWVSVGGLSYTRPTAVTSGNGRVDLFVRGTDGGVYYKYRTASGWSPSQTGWSYIGGVITDGVAAVSRAPNQLDMFVRGSDGALWTKALNGSTWWPAGTGWYRLGGSITGIPTAVSYGQTRLDVFARDVSGAVVWFWWAGAGWNGPISLGGAITDHPSATSWGPSRIDLFARGTGGDVVHKWFNGSYWNYGWESLGGWVDTAPTAIAPKGYVLEVMARGGDAALWHRRYEGGWRGWESLGGNITDEVAIASRYPGQIDLFVRDAGGAMFTKAHNGSVWWPSLGGWAWLGGDMLSSPAVVSTAWNRLDVFARGSENGLRTRWWDGTRWWN